MPYLRVTRLGLKSLHGSRLMDQRHGSVNSRKHHIEIGLMRGARRMCATNDTAADLESKETLQEQSLTTPERDVLLLDILDEGFATVCFNTALDKQRPWKGCQ